MSLLPNVTRACWLLFSFLRRKIAGESGDWDEYEEQMGAGAKNANAFASLPSDGDAAAARKQIEEELAAGGSSSMHASGRQALL